MVYSSRTIIASSPTTNQAFGRITTKKSFSLAVQQFLALVYSVPAHFILNSQLTCFFSFQMVQAIQVLRFHLLELEKVSIYSAN